MIRARMLAILAALALPATAIAKEPLDAAGLKALEAKVPQQVWYPVGYYDVRIAAEGQVADFPRDSLTMDWGDGEPPYYDVIDCNAEGVVPESDDPVTARYGAVALEVARLRAEFERLKYPVAVYREPLLTFEKARIEEAANGPDPLAYDDQAETADAAMATADAAVTADAVDAAEAAAAATSAASDDYEIEKDAYALLAEAVEANRMRFAPKLPKVLADGGCGAGEGGPVIVKTVPPEGEVLLINAFAFKVCTRKQPNPWDRFACKWNEVETGVEKQLSGRYVYQVKWPDGSVRKGTREITPEYEDDTATTVTFKKTGS